MEGHDSLLLGWYPTPTTPAYPAVDLPPGSQASASSTSNLVRLAPGDYPDLRTPIIQQHEPGETNSTTVSTGPVAAAAAAANAATAAAAATSTANATTSNNGATAPGVQSGVSNSSIASVSTAGGSGVSTTAVHLSSPAVAASSVGPIGNTRGTGGHNNETVVVHLASRMGSTVQQNAAASAQHHTQQQQQQAHSLHLSSHHAIVAPSVAQLHVTQGGGGQLATNQNGPMGGTQLLQQVVAHPAGAGGHQLVHMVLHHHGASAQANNAATAATLQLGGLTSVGGGGVTVQALTGGVSMANLGAGIGGAGVVGVSSFGVLESEETMGIANAGGPPFRCDECGHVAKTRRMLKRHLATVHSQERNFACPYCDAKYKSRSGLRVHSIKHNVGKHKCGVCDKLFPYKGALEEHMKVVHEDFRFRCTWEGCEFTTTSKYLLKGHVSYNHEGGKYVDNKFRKKCRFCEYVGYDIRGHESAMHGLEPRFECPTCGRKFHFGSNLRQHKRVHLPPDQYPFVCDVCGDRFLRRRQLEDHFIGKHTNEKPHLCVKCGFSCASRRTMSDHAAANCYEKEAAMRCKFCAFETKIPFTMRTHKEECHPKHQVKRKKQRKAWQSDSDDDGEAEDGADEQEEAPNAERQLPGAAKGSRRKAPKVVYMPWSVKPEQGDSEGDAADEIEEAPNAFVKQELLDGITPQTCPTTGQKAVSLAEPTSPLARETATPLVTVTAAAPTVTDVPVPSAKPPVSNLPRKRGRPPASRNGQSQRSQVSAADAALPSVPSLKVMLKPMKPAKPTARITKRKAAKKRVSKKRRKSTSDEDDRSDVDEQFMPDLNDDEDEDELGKHKLMREPESHIDDDTTKRRSTRRTKPASWSAHDPSTVVRDVNGKLSQQQRKKKNKPTSDRQQTVTVEVQSLATIKNEGSLPSMQPASTATWDNPSNERTASANYATEQPPSATFLVPDPPKRRGRPPKRKAALAAALLRSEEAQEDLIFEERPSSIETASVAGRGHAKSLELVEGVDKKVPIQDRADSSKVPRKIPDDSHSKADVLESNAEAHDFEKVITNGVDEADDCDDVVQISFGEDGDRDVDTEEITMMNCYECNTFFIDADKFREHMKVEHQFEMVISAD